MTDTVAILKRLEQVNYSHKYSRTFVRPFWIFIWVARNKSKCCNLTLHFDATGNVSYVSHMRVVKGFMIMLGYKQNRDGYYEY